MTRHLNSTRKPKKLIIKPLGFMLYLLPVIYPHLVWANTTSVKQLSTQEAAKQLGWVNDKEANQCGGYYIEPNLASTDTTTPNNLSKAPIVIRADSPEIHPFGQTVLTGNVTLDQPGRHIEGDKAVLNRDAKTGKVQTVDFYGMVKSREPSKIALGDSAHLNITADKGTYEDVVYRMALAFQPIVFSKTAQNQYKVHGLMAQGEASQLEQTSKGHYTFHHATYSTCSPVNNSWHLSAKTINLNKDTGRGNAHQAVLYAHGIPIFYTPYISFPIDKRRKSGFLSPSFGTSKRNGLSFTLPYYWNMAPNYDMTITPSWYSKRGVLTDTNNRLLTEHSRSNLELGLLPNDKAFTSFQHTALTEYAINPALPRLEEADDTRWYYRLNNTTSFSPNLKGNIKYTRLSDDYIEQDFSVHEPNLAAGQFLQQASLDYSGNFWDARVLVQQYQTLHPVTLLANNNQYSRFPDVTYNVNYLANNNFNYLLDSEFVDFHRDLNPGEVFNSPSGSPTDGTRSHLAPAVSYPWANSFAFLTPTVKMDMTQYDVENQPYNYNNHIDRAVPIFSVDSGLYFDRDITLFNQEYDQTFEPRLFYLNVPYRNQNQIPIFDTSLQSFNFDQLFQTNRFSSIDRIGDANQFSAALESHFISADTGAQKAAIGIGRIFYNENRRVTLCNTAGCTDSLYAVGATSPTEKESPLVGFANYNLNRDWSALATAAYDPPTRQVVNATASLRYQSAKDHLINVGYNYVEFGDPITPPTSNPMDYRNNLNQANTSFAWPVTNSLEALASMNYNISHKHFQTYFYGFGYNACCYAVRAGIARTFYMLSGTGNPLFNRQVFIQFVLKGFGGVGQTSTMNAVGTYVPGYQDPFNTSIM